MTTALTEPPVPPVAARTSTAIALVTCLRPRQWSKNVLVFAAPLGAGVLFRPHVLLASVGAFAALSCAASGTYLVNDVVDAEVDRSHPRKRHRPVAAGVLSSRLAVTMAVPMVVAGLGIGFTVRLQLGLTVVAYVLATLGYSLWLKREPVIELALLSMAFVLRAVAGGAASAVPLSKWFLVVAAFGSLFIATGKRASELGRVGHRVGHGVALVKEELASGSIRRSLVGYTPEYLRFVWSLAATVTVAGYCLWAFDVADRPSSLPWAVLSVVPFVLGLLRYAIEVDRGNAEDPEVVITGNPALLALGLLWALLFGLGAAGV